MSRPWNPDKYNYQKNIVTNLRYYVRIHFKEYNDTVLSDEAIYILYDNNCDFDFEAEQDSLYPTELQIGTDDIIGRIKARVNKADQFVVYCLLAAIYDCMFKPAELEDSKDDSSLT